LSDLKEDLCQNADYITNPVKFVERFCKFVASGAWMGSELFFPSLFPRFLMSICSGKSAHPNRVCSLSASEYQNIDQFVVSLLSRASL
jgi:hypothetical protein